MTEYDPAQVLAEATWLLEHPDFMEKPASIVEFLGEGYLEIREMVRPGLAEALTDIFGEEVNGDRIALYEEAMLTGAIGIGKTTFASIALPYMVHWVLCLRDPQKYFGLMPGSRIAFMQMSTSEDQARQVIFGDIKARIENSPWFLRNYPHDPKYTKSIRFPKDIWILPGDSAETTFEGYNILGGILDEMDSHKVTREKDYAEQGFNTINSRIASRFIDPVTKGHRGLLICIGQMKKAVGFAAKKYKEMNENPRAYVMRMTIWESLGWDKFKNPDGSRDSFWYDTRRKAIIPSTLVEFVVNKNMIEVPNAYLQQFKNKPENALKDLAGIPPEVSDPFITLLDRIELCREKWVERHGDTSPIDTNPTRPGIAEWFRANGDTRRRTVHIDIAYSPDGDSAGIAMGHVEKIVRVDEEDKPYIVVDCLIRVRAAPGSEIMLSDLRNYVYTLKDERGFRIVSVTLDGFQSTDTMQQLRKRRYFADYLSVDRSTLPYEDLREAIYDRRLEFPPYLTYLNKGDEKPVEIAIQELSQLQETARKVDHPVGGSKDVADTMAGVVNTLMGDRVYRRGVSSATPISSDTTSEDWGAKGADNVVPLFPPAGSGYGEGLRAPVPVLESSGTLGISLPQRLRPNRGSR